MQTILVTGGTGYIGSHTVVELLQKNYNVIVVDNLSNSTTDSLDGIEKICGKRPIFYQNDCSNMSEMTSIFDRHPEIAASIHFAASKAVGESVEKPLLYYRNNLLSLINLLECIKTHAGGGIVFSSSCTVYGQPDVLPVTEQAPMKKAESPYGNTKQIAEDIIVDTVAAYPEIKAIALRYFNPIGAHPSAEIGELPLGVPNNLIPFVTQTAYGLRSELKVFGNDYNTPDGTPVRDYINVVDLAKAHVIAVDRLLTNKGKKAVEVFNLGTGTGLSVLEVIKAFENATGVKLPYSIVDRRAGDIEKVWADTAFANKELGWSAKETIEDTMRSAWEWEKRYRSKVNITQ
ncbi:UDP-glucose 4-epimerase GalE [Williamwhitmania taraxaci]|uniref:UDP-glucose 4-epimerase n=1 Tax=Williamwhitmania taraxaci TaxID=1640674 RepID=A0A1G6MYV9_9BACT|nr:UDP-glucose 4-epimerase GalE [Williamwhitmania taraxaci]SDC60732.1 UDP-galactose 4-epimerase [Williamwhitmania taraxaci]